MQDFLFGPYLSEVRVRNMRNFQFDYKARETNLFMLLRGNNRLSVLECLSQHK